MPSEGLSVSARRDIVVRQSKGFRDQLKES